MDMRDEAGIFLAHHGWLARQHAEFRAEGLDRAVVERFMAGEAVYHLGDPLGGICGVASGLLSITAAPGRAIPRLIHLSTPGAWTGEGCFLTAEPRRIGLRAIADSVLLHLPLGAMEQIAARDPWNTRRFGQIALFDIDITLRVIHDLLITDPDRRIGAVLLRAGGSGAAPIPLSQSDIGGMANASRKQVNYALRRFAEAGWVEHSYRTTTVVDAPGLRVFVAMEDEA